MLISLKVFHVGGRCARLCNFYRSLKFFLETRTRSHAARRKTSLLEL